MHQQLCVCILLVCLAGPAAARCEARSGSQTAALVELYTAERCSSCPPADRWLANLSDRAGVVPLALYVDSRDYSGSRDRYVRRNLTLLQRMALVYTPQVLLQGREFRGWGTPAFDGALGRINAQPARARLYLEARKAGRDSLEAFTRAELLEALPASRAALYIAAYENRVTSRILEWQGPIDLSREGRLSEVRRLPLVPGAAVDNSGVVAFVQDRGTGEVLQALALPACFS